MRTAAIVVVLGLSTAILGGTCSSGLPAPGLPVPGHGESIRIGTFNAQFLPGSDDDESRSARIAHRILDSGYDIIALNEVFDEEARGGFVEMLRDEYPHFVAFLDDDAIGSQDSGLMLFSVFPFEPLPISTYQAGRHGRNNVMAENGRLGDWGGDVAFIEYREHMRIDTMSAKGAALVRIRNPQTGRIYNVVFTHTQASYPEDEESHENWIGPINIRASQLEQIQRLIDGTLTSTQIAREDLFVLGDLNIDGDLRDPNHGSATCCAPNLYEWVERFRTPGSFFTDTLHDTWAFEQPADDRGVTFDPGLTNFLHWGPDFVPDMGARLDYILRSRTPGPQTEALCVQHLTLAYNLRDGAPSLSDYPAPLRPPEGGIGRRGIGRLGVNDLSDHLGLNADINRWAEYCNPLEAWGAPLDVLLPGRITYPGSMQWFRFDDPGTYSFALQGAGTEYRVYEASDMSRPVPQFFNQTREIRVVVAVGAEALGERRLMAQKYVLPTAPFFIRVFMPDRAATGTYEFAAHRHEGSSRDDAIQLWPNDPHWRALPSTPLNAEDTTWFQIRTERADSGKSQQLRFVVDQYTADVFSLELRTANGSRRIDAAMTSVPDPDNPGGRRLVIERNDLNPAASTMFLLVRRTDPSVTSYRVRWETNLTALHGQLANVRGAGELKLTCVEETDTIGIDEIYLTVVVDGTVRINDRYLRDFDDDDWETLENLIPAVRYLDNVTIMLREEDGGLNFGEDSLQAVITGLRPDQTEHLGDAKTLACCGGEYVVAFNRSRSLSEKPIAGRDVP